MMTQRFTYKFLAATILLLTLFSHCGFSQTPLPFTIKNNSQFADNQLYVAIVGEDLTGPPGAHVWVDMKTGQQKPMSPSYNTVAGPVYNGNKGPGGNGMYANCFTKLSDIPNKTVSLAGIQGCRMFISVEKQLYLYFFGATGAPSGYASPNHTDPTDPNQGIQYELIELTYNGYGFWGNTTRVDGYNYPMAIELNGAGGFQKAGELKTHAEIGAAFKASVPTEFQGCYDAAKGNILFPTKTAAFADGSIGTMPTPGPYVNYMKPYIDAVWAKYANEDLIFNAGDAGIWKGRVQGERLVMTCQSGAAGFIGRTGIIERRPTTQEAFEGKGVLDKVISDGTVDLIMQSQVCAALTRHVINVTTPNVGLQTWSDPSKYYLESPCNHYAKFWHMQGISANQLSYGFAYDDVFNQSSTLHSPAPTNVTVIFGGYAPLTPVTQSPYGGTRLAIPGTLQAENYDLGGENLAYHDSETANQGNAYRTDGVDIEATTGGGYNVGYIVAGEWLKYMVNVTTAGKYRLVARVATNAAGKSFTIDADGTTIATVNVPNTGDWQTWQTVTIDNVALTAGNKTLRIYATTGDFNLDNIVFSLMPNVAPTVSLTAPTVGTTVTAPATITISANAADSDGSIAKVEFYQGSTLLNSDATSPYSYSWANVAAGTYSITAKAYDNSGAVTTSAAVSITVKAPNVAPTVSLTAPTTGTTVTAPATITISANAADSDGSIAKVEFYQGSTLLNSDATSPYSYSWANVAAGTYSITAKAYDNSGAVTTSAAVSITVKAPNVAPTVSLTSPTTGTTVTAPATITISANAADSDGSIAKVEFYQGSTLLNSDAASPYSYSWTNVAAGTYSITAKAYDNSGAVTTSSAVSITVKAPNVAPTVSLTAPTTGATFTAPATITISANAADSDGSIAKVEFYQGSTLLNSDAASPYSYSWTNVAAGTYSITAKAYDNEGAVTTSSAISITVKAPNVAPTVSLTAPTAGTTFTSPATVTISANAADSDGSIAKVEFYNGATLLNSDATAPYSYSWTGVTAGTYSITAKAYDNTGAVTTSAAVSITVKAPNVGPTVSLTAPTTGATFTAPATITISANAADSDGSIARVEFYSGATLLNTDVTAPYTYDWTGVPAGTYTITAQTYDNSTGMATSSAVTITVKPAPTGTENCANIAVWNTNSVYVNGDFVIYENFKYKAKWWTKGEIPANSGQWDVWQKIGECIEGTASATAPRISMTPDNATDLTVAQALNINVQGLSSGTSNEVQYILYKDTVRVDLIKKTGTDFNASWTASQIGNYLLQVIVKDQNGLQIFSDAKTINVTKTTGVDDNLLDGAFTVYPNPTTGIVNIGADADNVEVVSIEGQSLPTNFTKGMTQVDLSAFSEGVYILRITKGADIRFERIVKIN